MEGVIDFPRGWRTSARGPGWGVKLEPLASYRAATELLPIDAEYEYHITEVSCPATSDKTKVKFYGTSKNFQLT